MEVRASTELLRRSGRIGCQNHQVQGILSHVAPCHESISSVPILSCVSANTIRLTLANIFAQKQGPNRLQPVGMKKGMKDWRESHHLL